MLSKNMYEALTQRGHPSRLKYHDKRTLKALHRRRLIYAGFYRRGKDWIFVISTRGYSIRRDLLNMNNITKQNVFSKWESGK